MYIPPLEKEPNVLMLFIVVGIAVTAIVIFIVIVGIVVTKSYAIVVNGK